MEKVFTGARRWEGQEPTALQTCLELVREGDMLLCIGPAN